MKTDSTNACPKCGATVPADAPQGLCPKCVLAAASAPEPAPTATSQIPSLERLAVAFPQLQILELIGRGSRTSTASSPSSCCPTRSRTTRSSPSVSIARAACSRA